jgi:hypothetical protein
LGWTLSAVTADMVGGVVHDAMKPSVLVTAGKPLPAFQALDSALLALPAQINQWLTHERQRCGSQCEIMLDSVKKLIGTSNSLLAQPPSVNSCHSSLPNILKNILKFRLTLKKVFATHEKSRHFISTSTNFCPSRHEGTGTGSAHCWPLCSQNIG